MLIFQDQLIGMNVMSEFAPGIAAARLALGDAVKIESHYHPAGATGVKFSLEQVALRARDGRNDPRVRAWAIRAIHDAGGPQDQKAQAVAILTALRRNPRPTYRTPSIRSLSRPLRRLCA